MSALPILLVEDDENDIQITRRAIAKSGTSSELMVARDGQEALDLIRLPRVPGRIHPGLVLLDISLPKLNGLDVLGALKADPLTRRMPVLMLTTSARQEDVLAAYARGANGFICKPIQFLRFVQVVREVIEYWNLVARGDA